MVEAGADEVPEDVLLEALELAHARDPQALRGAGGSAPPGRQGEVARHGAHRRDRGASTGTRSGSASRATASARRAPSSTSSQRSSPARSRWTRPRTTSSARRRSARASAMLLEKQRLVAVEGPVREQFENDLRALTDAEQDSKELKSAKRHLLFDQIVNERRAAVPGRPGDRRRRQPPASKDSLTKSYDQEGRRGDLQGPRPQEDRGRQAAARRPRHRGDPADRGRGRRQPARARLRPLHARPDAGPLDAHARHREGGPADRRPVARDRPPLHAPLQLPALLGRGDRLHARPEAPRHRPRCARAARARGDDPRRRRTSRTRFASCPRRSSRTARRRWARSAARRSR